MDMNEGVGSTYKYYTGEQLLYDFAYGLNYAKFAVEEVGSDNDVVSISTSGDDSVDINMSVTRTDEGNLFEAAQLILTAFVVPVNVTDNDDCSYVVNKMLVDFVRTGDVVEGGDAVEVGMSIAKESFALANDDGALYVYGGDFEVRVNNGVEDVVVKKVSISGEKMLVSKFPEGQQKQ